MKKKFLAVAMTAVMAAVSLTGCGNDSSSDSGTQAQATQPAVTQPAVTQAPVCSNGIGCNICPLTGMLPDTDREVRIHSRNV